MIFIRSTTSGAKELRNRRYVSSFIPLSFIPLFSIKTQQKLSNDDCHCRGRKLEGHGGGIGEGDGIMRWRDLEEIQKWAVSGHSTKLGARYEPTSSPQQKVTSSGKPYHTIQ
jgi:hypothetical protein